MRFTSLNTTREIVIYLAENGIRDARVVLNVDKKRVVLYCHGCDVRWAERIMAKALLPENPRIEVRKLRWWHRKPYKIEVHTQ